jgi:hypothetical protein
MTLGAAPGRRAPRGFATDSRPLHQRSAQKSGEKPPRVRQPQCALHGPRAAAQRKDGMHAAPEGARPFCVRQTAICMMSL